MENHQSKSTKNRNSIDEWIAKQINNPYRFSLYLLIIIVFVFVIMPIVMTKNYGLIHFDEDASYIGNTYGGIVGPMVTFIGVIITFLAFYIQYRANQIQYEILQKQANLQQKQDLERRALYYYDIINNLKLNEISKFGSNQHQISSRSFAYLIDEFKAIYTILASFNRIIIHIKHKGAIDAFIPELIPDDSHAHNELDLSILSWHYCFEGIEDPYDHENFFIEVFSLLGFDFLKFEKLNFTYALDKAIFGSNCERINNALRWYYNDNSIDITPMLEQNIININEIRSKNENGAFSFNGHSEILSNYFQLAYQVIKVINEDQTLNYNEKYDLVKILRAQMSRDEMTILFLNSLHEYGAPWEFNHRNLTEHIKPNKNADNCLITKYNLIKNIPVIKGIFIYPEDYFPDLIFIGDDEETRTKKSQNRIFN